MTHRDLRTKYLGSMLFNIIYTDLMDPVKNKKKKNSENAGT